MKKAFRVFVVVIVLSFALATAISAYAATLMRETKGRPVVKFIKSENERPYLIKTYADGSACQEDFTIITFADLHLDGKTEIPGDSTALTVMENAIKHQNPDLVVLCGDIVLGPYAKRAARALAELFEKHNQYWGYVLGNHDAESEIGLKRAEIVSYFSEYEHCVISSAPDISGEGNCIVNLKNAQGKVIQSLVFIDSGNYLDPDICAEYGFEYKEGYDFIKYDQIEWYKSEMYDIAEQNGGMPDSVMFMHIPLKEYRMAYNQAKQNDTVIFGKRRESECDSHYNTGMFDAILEVDSTKAVICGHDHVNDYCVEYMGVKLLYSLSVAYNSYFLREYLLYVSAYNLSGQAEFNDGYTLLSIDKKGELQIIPRYFQENPSLFEGLTQEQRNALYLDQTLPKSE